MGQLDQILLRLEQKGMKNNIFKYKEMQQLRAKRSTKVQDKLEQFGPEKSIIDSSQVIGAYVILKYFTRANDERKKRNENKAREAKAAAAAVEVEPVSNTMSDVHVAQQIGEKTPVVIQNQTGSRLESRLEQVALIQEQRSLSRNDSGPGNDQGKLLLSDEKIYVNNSSRSYVISPLSSQV